MLRPYHPTQGRRKVGPYVFGPPRFSRSLRGAFAIAPGPLEVLTSALKPKFFTRWQAW